MILGNEDFILYQCLEPLRKRQKAYRREINLQAEAMMLVKDIKTRWFWCALHHQWQWYSLLVPWEAWNWKAANFSLDAALPDSERLMTNSALRKM